ncbi:MAG: DUF2520 domain-containing protein [Desulfobacteraceae bacterium]|nr:DUF2520 domain-containing protein [Desulfobacteraceae bacterium]MBC2754653.1 DUF2520 domain-containing protein [Desulfobacteraceae bacterium]
MKLSFSIIGCGKVGSALGKQLAEAGYRPVGFSSRRMISARQAAEFAGVPDRCFEKIWEAAKDADLVFITTPDDAIKETCRTISKNNGFTENAVVFHCSGALSSIELASVKSCNAKSGVMTGSMHPLQSFASEDPGKPGNPFDNIMMAIEGDPGAVEKAREIAKDLGAQPFTIRTDGKILYHAAAVVASNYLVTLMDLSIKLMAASGVLQSEAFDILKPLIQGTLANIESTGIPDALTGPIARGDVGIVEKHVQAIRSLSDETADGMADYYCMSGVETIKVARAKGTLSEDAAKQLLQILKSE